MKDIYGNDLNPTDINYGLLAGKTDTQSTLLSDITGGAIATAVDFGVSVYNSLPFTEETTTNNVLAQISENALDVYQQNTDTINTLSFVAGSLLPAGAAIKGLQAARAGVKGVSWFSNAGKSALIKQADELMANGQAATGALNAIKRKMIANGILNNALDSAAAEVAILGTMNAHPMLEDYWDNPAANFGMALGFGTVVGGAVGTIADFAALNKSVGKIESAAFDIVQGAVDTPLPAMPTGAALQTIKNNKASLQNIIADTYSANELTKQVAKNYLEQETARERRLLEKLTSEEYIASVTPEVKDRLVGIIQTDKAFSSVDSITRYIPDSTGKAKPATPLTAVSSLFSKAKDTNKVKADTGVYLTEFGTIVSPEDADNFLRTASLNETRDSLRAGRISAVPEDFIASTLAESKAAEADRLYLRSLLQFAEAKPKELRGVAIAHDDLPKLQAAFSRLRKETMSGTELANLKLVVATPRKEVVEAEYKAATDFVNSFKQTLNTQDESLIVKNLPPNAYAKGEKRTGIATEAFPTKALMQQKLEPIAKDGYVYAYLTKEGKTASSTRYNFMSLEPVNANSRLHKIKVDSVVGLSQDGKLVVNGAGDVEKLATTARGGYVTKEVGANELGESILSAKENLISKMLADGIPIQSIAIRTGTPVNTVTAFATGANAGERLVDIVKKDPSLGLMTYTDAAEIDKYLGFDYQALAVRGNASKLEFSKIKANLDVKSGEDVNSEWIKYLTQTSNSELVQSFHKEFFDPDLGLMPAVDLLKTKLSEFANSNVGGTFLSSADQALRNTVVGPVVTTVGKAVRDISTRLTGKVVKTIDPAMAEVAKDAVATLEFNTFAQVNAGVSGVRKVLPDGTLAVMTIEKGKEVWTPVMYQGMPYKVKTPSVLNLISDLEAVGKEIYEQANTIRGIKGASPLSNIGMWIPTFNPREAEIAYVFNSTTKQTQLLVAKTPEQLEQLRLSFERSLPPGTTDIQVITKQSQELWSEMNNRLDPLTMQRADVNLQKSGAAQQVVVKNTNEIFGEILNAYEHHIENNSRQLTHLALHDVLDQLDMMSKYNKRLTENQPQGFVNTYINQPKDGARAVRNTLLGVSNLTDNTSWQAANQSMESWAAWGFKAVKDTLLPALPKIKEGKATALDYETVSKQLEARGIPNPYAAFDAEAANMFKLASITENPNITPRIVYASNALAATLALRLMDFAHPIVNAMSFPIMSSLVANEARADSFLGIARSNKAINPTKLIYDGARFANHPEGIELAKAWKEKGYFKGYVSEANDIMRASRQFDKSALGAIEKGLDSKLVQMLSKPSDMAEDFLREQAMMTGAVLAREMYPGLGNSGITIFARDFADRTLGNYYAPQRPVFFQGTLGVAMGLFQTYMLTLGQSVYRNLEMKNYKAIGKAALAQSGVFGFSSLPGFDVVSQYIGENMSDNNVDLTTGTYRAFDDDVANAVIFGLPSSLGAAIYSRGDINPRVNTPLDLSSLPAVNMVAQSATLVTQLAQAMGSEDKSRAVLQALSMQSMSRPIARWSELASGYSVTASGKTMQTPDEVYTMSGILSRVFAVRPMEEAKLREVDHLNVIYNRLDRENKQEVSKQLKTAIREGSLTQDKTEELASQYFDNGGTPAGWRQLLNNANIETTQAGVETTMAKLKPDNPLNYMIDGLD